MARARLEARALVVVLAVTMGLASTASASPQLTKPQYIAKADALCSSAVAQIRRLSPLYPASRTAAIGDRWLAIDRATLAKLRALSPPAADRATVSHILALASTAINKGLVAVVAAAKARNSTGYATASQRFGAMIKQARAAAARYGASECARW